MTLHTAKGLEFNYVFIVGMEEKIFPSYKSVVSGGAKEMEEERRLCYVGITRAKNNLYFTCAKHRTIFGSTSYNAMSRFVEEIPEEVEENKYCYTPEKGFYINENWKEPVDPQEIETRISLVEDAVNSILGF